jgi:hypothetical protein
VLELSDDGRPTAAAAANAPPGEALNLKPARPEAPANFSLGPGNRFPTRADSDVVSKYFVDEMMTSWRMAQQRR